jgi:hypothetical protein
MAYSATMSLFCALAFLAPRAILNAVSRLTTVKASESRVGLGRGGNRRESHFGVLLVVLRSKLAVDSSPIRHKTGLNLIRC